MTDRQHHGPKIPPAVSAWLAAHALHDVDTEVAQFSESVVVVDDGHEYRGRDAARAWSAALTRKFDYTATVLTTDEAGDAVVATTRLEGDFPGSPVLLRYQFILRDGLISALTIGV